MSRKIHYSTEYKGFRIRRRMRFLWTVHDMLTGMNLSAHLTKGAAMEAVEFYSSLRVGR